MHEQGIPFPTIVEVSGKDPKEIQGVLGEHGAKEFNEKQKKVGLLSRL